MISALLYNTVFLMPIGQPVLIYFIISICLLAILIVLCFTLLLKRRKSDKLTIRTYSTRISELGKSINTLIRNANTDIFLFDEQNKILYKYDGVNFVRDDVTQRGLERQIHPDDLDQYCKDYSDIINHVIDTVVSNLRIYNQEINKFEQFEHIVNPIEYSDDGKVTKYIYSRRNVTAENMKKAEQTMKDVNMHLALRFGELLSWQYNPDERISRFLDGNYNEYTLTDEELLDCLDLYSRDTYKLYLQKLITNQLCEQTIEFVIKLPSDLEYKKYKVIAMSYFDAMEPTTISGVWKASDK